MLLNFLVQALVNLFQIRHFFLQFMKEDFIILPEKFHLRAQRLILFGKNGAFLGCSGYPDCKNTKEFLKKESGEIAVVEEKPVEETCAKCGAPLPHIEPGMYNVKCSHCGMTMVVTWSEGKISYKALKEVPG